MLITPFRERAEVNPEMNIFTPSSDSGESSDAKYKTLAAPIKECDKQWTAHLANPTESIGSGPWCNAKDKLLAIKLTSDISSSRMTSTNEKGTITNYSSQFYYVAE